MKSFTSFFVCIALVSVLVVAVPAQRTADRAPEFVPGQMLVQFKAGVGESEIVRVLGKVNGAAIKKVRAARSDNYRRGDLVLARIPDVITPAATRREIEAEPTVEFAEPNWVYRHTDASNDTYYTNGQLWGMYGDATSPANQYGSQAGEAWNNGHTNCGNVIVGVIDEGIYYNHVDLSANIWTNPYDAADGIDNDGNGYVDDIRGWDFDGNSNNINSGGTSDDHGTHVAGTIGGVGGNGTGVAGVCWNIEMISGKFLGRRGGTTANAIEAVDYFTDLKTRHGLNIVATNNSWGGGGFSQALKDAIDRAGAQDILFVAAAGNDGVNTDSSPHYPSSYTSANIISVASITSSGGLSSFSNYGSTSVDIGAPGSSIVSTVPAKSGKNIVSGYASYSGTSMATPHVTGAAALYAAYHGGSSAAQIKSAIFSSATPTASLNGRVATGSRLNVGGF